MVEMTHFFVCLFLFNILNENAENVPGKSFLVSFTMKKKQKTSANKKLNWLSKKKSEQIRKTTTNRKYVIKRKERRKKETYKIN